MNLEDPGLGEDPAAPPSAAAPRELRATALLLLIETQPERKAAGVRALDAAFRADAVALAADAVLVPAAEVPGRPPRPELVPPLSLPARAMVACDASSASMK